MFERSAIERNSKLLNVVGFLLSIFYFTTYTTGTNIEMVRLYIDRKIPYYNSVLLTTETVLISLNIQTLEMHISYQLYLYNSNLLYLLICSNILIAD